MTDNKNDKAKVDLGLLEEDDEFEEFPAEGTHAILSIRCICDLTSKSLIHLRRLDRKGRRQRRYQCLGRQLG